MIQYRRHTGSAAVTSEAKAQTVLVLMLLSIKMTHAKRSVKKTQQRIYTCTTRNRLSTVEFYLIEHFLESLVD